MSLRASISVFLLGAGLGVGCGVGGDEPFEPVPIEPNPEGIVCTDGFKVNGTFQLAATPTPDPDNDAGCWPVGTWTFTATRDTTDEQILDVTGDGLADRCGSVASTAAAVAESSYSFTVTRVEKYVQNPGGTPILIGYDDQYAMVGATTDAGAVRWAGKYVERIKVTQGGAGSCQGSVELFSADRKELWTLKPYLSGTTLAGLGEYTRYQEARP